MVLEQLLRALHPGVPTESRGDIACDFEKPKFAAAAPLPARLHDLLILPAQLS